MKSTRAKALLTALIAAPILFAVGTTSQAWEPTHPVEVTNPFSAGGDSDLSGRAAMAAAEKFLGKPLVTVNRPGAGSAIGHQFVRSAKPDGYSIIWTSGSLLTNANMGNVPFNYDAFRQVARMGIMPTVIAVRSDSPWKDLKDMLAYAKENPGKLKLSNSGHGSFTFVAAKVLEELADVRFIDVPLGSDRRVSTVLSGEVDATIAHAGEVMSSYKSKDFRFLAISMDERYAMFPETPTFKEQGYDLGINNFRGIAVPLNTPDDVVEHYIKVFEKASHESEWTKVAEGNLGYQTAFLAGQPYLDSLKTQNDLIRKVFVKAGLAK